MEKKNLLLAGSNCCEDFEWDDLTDSLTELMKKKNPSGNWYARMSGFGWRGTSGEKNFRANTGEGLLSAILPDTDCNFKIYKYGRNGFAVNNSHHDSPVGAEWYYIIKSNKIKGKFADAEILRGIKYKDSKITLYGSREQIDEIIGYLDQITLQNNEGLDRLVIQKYVCPLMDKPRLEGTSLLYSGNTVYGEKKLLRDFKKLIIDYEYDNFTDELYKFFSLCCGSIAHYNKSGWFSEYPSLSPLREFFIKNEYGQSVLRHIPHWQTDVVKIVTAMEKLLGISKKFKKDYGW